jgi:membrane-bound lytic murein transglycosylase B
VAVPAKLNSGVPAGIKPGKATTAQALRKAGVQFSDKIDGDARASLIELDTGDGDKQYWVGLRNFKVIMSYNHSPLYAMAVYQLSNAIKKGKRGSAG